MSSKDYVVLIGKKRQVSSKRQPNEGQETLETEEQLFPWALKQANRQISDELRKRKKKRKTKHHVPNKSTVKFIGTDNTSTDLQSDKDFCNATERTASDICITRTFSLADVQTKANAEAFVNTLKSRLKEPKSGRKINRVQVTEHKEPEIEKLRRKIARLQKRNIELEMNNRYLHNFLKEILSSQVQEKAVTESKSVILQKDQQGDEGLENGCPRQLELDNYTNEGKICSAKPNDVPNATEGSPSHSNIVTDSHANIPVLNGANQVSSSDENSNTKTQIKVSIPVGKSPSSDSFVGEWPAPPSYEVALNIYPPSEPWKHLQHVSLQPANETHLNISCQNLVHDYHSSVSIGSGLEISQSLGNTNFILLNQTQRFRRKNHLEVSASCKTTPNSYSDTQISDTETKSCQKYLPPKCNLKEKNTAVSSFETECETQCDTRKLSSPGKEISKTKTSRKMLPLAHNKNEPHTCVLSRSTSCTCNDGLNDKISVTTKDVVDAKEKNIGTELSENHDQRAWKENPLDPVCFPQILFKGNRSIPTPVKFPCCPNYTCEKNSSKDDDSAPPSPEFPPPSQDRLKTTAGHNKQTRKNSLRFCSNVKEEVMEIQTTADNSPKAPFKSSNNSINDNGVTAGANGHDTGNVCVKNENVRSQCCSS